MTPCGTENSAMVVEIPLPCLQNSFEMTSSIEDYVKPEDLVRATSNDTDLGRLRAD